jgi:hypothetical protein
VVDLDHIQQQLDTYYTVEGDLVIHDDGVVDVQGHVMVLNLPKNRIMSVQFGTVTGDFRIPARLKPASLQGCPHRVEGVFYIGKDNKITSLQQGPTWVGKSYVVMEGNLIQDLTGVAHHVDLLVIHTNTLRNLDDLPEQINYCQCEYHEQLPILRLIQVPRLYLRYAPLELQHILDKYVGKGKSAMLNCALDLKQAGFAGNAKW